MLSRRHLFQVKNINLKLKNVKLNFKTINYFCRFQDSNPSHLNQIFSNKNLKCGHKEMYTFIFNNIYFL